MPQECEIKYRAAQQQLALLEADFTPFCAIAMETTYFDTPAGELSRRRWTLRRRLENGESVCTFKTPGNGLSRGEWETACEDISQAIPALISLGAPAELQTLAAQGLIPSCGAKFTRLAKTLSYGGATLELALDRGVLTGKQQSLPLSEVEVELKAGQTSALLAFAVALAEKYALTPEEKSKAARAMALK